MNYKTPTKNIPKIFISNLILEAFSKFLNFIILFIFINFNYIDSLYIIFFLILD